MSVPWGQENLLFHELFRYAFYLRNERQQAMADIRRAVQKLSGKPEAAERDRGARFLFNQVRRQKSGPLPSPAPTAASASTALPLLQQLPEPDRSLAGLFYLTSFSPADLSRLLGLSVPEMASRLHTLRRELAPKFQLEAPVGIARDVCQLERPGDPPPETPPTDPREIFDRKVHTDLAVLAPAPAEIAELGQISQTLEARSRAWKPTFKDPAMLGLACGLLLLVGLVGWILVRGQQEFTGQPVAATLITRGAEANAQEFEPVQVPLSDLGDWLALQGIEEFWVPTGFSHQETLAARVFSLEGVRVASVLLPQHHLVVYLFDGPQLGLSVQPEGAWQFFSTGQDAGAIAQKGRLCFLVAYRGTVEDLQNILQKLLPQS